jgi:hypothetical protein
LAEKIPTRVVRMNLPLDLIAVLDAMRGEVELPFSREPYRRLPEMIQCCLKWAACAYVNGRNPDEEMLAREGGYTSWNKKSVEPDIEELERLYRLGESPDSQPES